MIDLDTIDFNKKMEFPSLSCVNETVDDGLIFSYFEISFLPMVVLLGLYKGCSYIIDWSPLYNKGKEND